MASEESLNEAMDGKTLQKAIQSIVDAFDKKGYEIAIVASIAGSETSWGVYSYNGNEDTDKFDMEEYRMDSIACTLHEQVATMRSRHIEGIMGDDLGGQEL